MSYKRLHAVLAASHMGVAIDEMEWNGPIPIKRYPVPRAGSSLPI